MDHTQLSKSSRESWKDQPAFPEESSEELSINLAQERVPAIEYELLTLRDACNRFRGLHEKLVYRWVRERRLHPVRPNGRRLYPSWELETLHAEHTGRTSKPLYTYVAGAA